MTAKADMSLDDALAREDRPYARLVLQYTQTMKRILDGAKTDPGFSAASWAPLAALVDVARFERVGTFRETVRWPEYAQLLTDWSLRSKWDVRVRRITEHDRVVFLELEEFGEYDGMSDQIFSLSVYAFDADRKLNHLDVYMQREQVALPEGTWDLAEA